MQNKHVHEHHSLTQRFTFPLITGSNVTKESLFGGKTLKITPQHVKWWFIHEKEKNVLLMRRERESARKRLDAMKRIEKGAKIDWFVTQIILTILNKICMYIRSP